MGPVGPAGVQYNEWTGTIALDDADQSSIHTLIQEHIGDTDGRYFVAGYSLFITPPLPGRDTQDIGINAYLVENPTAPITNAANPDGTLDVIEVNIAPTPDLETLFETINKRCHIVLNSQGVAHDNLTLNVTRRIQEDEYHLL